MAGTESSAGDGVAVWLVTVYFSPASGRNPYIISVESVSCQPLPGTVMPVAA